MLYITELKVGEGQVIYRTQVSAIQRNFVALIAEMQKEGLEGVEVFKNNIRVGYWELDEDL